MPVPAIVIGAIGTAATVAGTEATGVLSQKLTGSAHHQGGTIDNESDLDLKLMRQGQPRHGLWAVPGESEISAEPSPQTLFDAWQQSPKSPAEAKNYTSVDDLPDGLAELLAQWIENDVNFNASTGMFGLKSHGAGVEGILVYGDINKDIAIAFYLATPDVGAVHAGCLIKTYTTMQETIDSDNDKLENIRSEIRDAQSSDTEAKFSSGESMEVTLGDYTVSFAAAEETLFKLTGGTEDTLH